MGREIDQTSFKVFCETAAWAKWLLSALKVTARVPTSLEYDRLLPTRSLRRQSR